VNERIDEEIGALLDGRVDERRRTELLALLAADDADYDVFADTAAVLREAEDEASEKEAEHEPEGEARPTTKVIPLRPRRAAGWRSSPARWMALAEAVAALALVPVLRSRMNAGAWRDPARMAAMSGQRGARLPTEWTHSWNVSRGAGGGIEEVGVFARAGALEVDLERAAASADFDQASLLAGQIAALLDDVRGAVSVSSEYHTLADDASRRDPKLAELIASARRDLTASAGDDATADYLGLGAWTEAARLAAKRQGAAFFHARESRDALKHAAALPGLDDDARAAVERIRALTDQGEVRDWASLHGELEELQKGLGR
jgi:hypothetical protein